MRLCSWESQPLPSLGFRGQAQRPLLGSWVLSLVYLWSSSGTDPEPLEPSHLIPDRPLAPVLAHGPVLVCCPHFSRQPSSHFSFILQPQSWRLLPTPGYENHGSSCLRGDRGIPEPLGLSPWDTESLISKLSASVVILSNSNDTGAYHRIGSCDCPKPRHQIPDRCFILSLLGEAMEDTDISLRSPSCHSTAPAVFCRSTAHSAVRLLFPAVASWNTSWSLPFISDFPPSPEPGICSFPSPTQPSRLLSLPASPWLSTQLISTVYFSVVPMWVEVWALLLCLPA